MCGSARLPFGGSAPYLRMNDLFEIAARLRVGEHDLGQSGTIESLVPQHALAETADNGGKSGRARLDHLTCELVRVDDHRATTSQLVGDR